ncbi:hypothetical protein, partial [Immundisolibacter sp.]|uniref:hypothetical protein n=1 Tax=Immundisolibacter sp. TaxID=1934948 RepID=UPI003561BBD1
MNHKVKLWVNIWNETRTAYLRGETEISLPFIPTLGIKLRFEGVSDTLVINEIVWSMQENFFECLVEPDCI